MLKNIKKTIGEPWWDSILLGEKGNREKFTTAIGRKQGNEGERFGARWVELKKTMSEVEEEQFLR
jgi:hypothetical protein